MAARKAAKAEFTVGRFEMKSASQLQFLLDVMERNELSVTDVETRFDNTVTFPSKWGFKVLDALRQDERDESHARKVGLEPTENQLDALLYYRGLALESGRKKLAQDLKDLHESICDRAAVSLALGACQRIWPKDKAADDTTSAPNTDEGFGDEDFGGK